jgi:hypothetical protein
METDLSEEVAADAADFKICALGFENVSHRIYMMRRKGLKLDSKVTSEPVQG